MHRLRAHVHCLSACLSAHEVLRGGPVAGINSDGNWTPVQIQRMVKLQNIREIKDLNAIKAKK